MTAALLSDEKRDALQELVNIGMGAAGAALAKALGTFVELAVPAVDFTSRGRVAALLDAGTWANEDLEAVRQPFFGRFTGESLMLLDAPAKAELADLLGYGQEPGSTEHHEALLDLANVVIGACVNGIAEALNEGVSFAPPTRLGGRSQAYAFLSREEAALHQGLVVNVDFRLEARSFNSRVLVFLPEHSIARINDALTRLLDGLAAS